MTFDELMKSMNGKWEDDVAVVQDRGGYFWRIATRNGTDVTLTADGKRMVGSQPATLANTSASKVESPKRHGRKAAIRDDDLSLE